MTVRTIRQETDGTFGYGSGWTNEATKWGILTSLKKCNTPGSLATLTLPAHHGFTGGVFLGYGANDATANAVIAVDGVVIQATWNQKFTTNSDSHYYLPRILSYPFPLRDSAAAQVITIASGADGGVTYLDGVELYTAATPITGRVTRIGHSMEYPVVDQNTLGPNTAGHGQLFVAYLTATKYLGISTWTDDNQAVPSEDLSNGGANSGLVGGLNTSVLYTQFANQAFYANPAIPTPGWMRLEAGDLWPATHAPRLDALSLMSTDSQYMVGVPQWWARAFQYGVFFHNFNDPGYSTLYDNPADGIVANGASATGVSDVTATGNWATGTGTFTITTPVIGGGSAATAAIAQNTDLATVQARLLAVNSMYIATSAVTVGSVFVANGNKITFTAVGNPSPLLSLTLSPVGGAGTIAAAVTTTARAKTAAGAGYGMARFIQRFREALIRVALAITPCPRVAIIGMPNFVNGAAMSLSVYQQYDAAMRAVLDEPWIANLTGGAPFYFVSPMAAMTGFPSNVSGADAHPSTAGHQAIFDELRRAHRRNQATTLAPTTAFLTP